MIKKQPLISVVMPAFNAEKYIAKAIESILDQTYSNLELIIINDASHDNTLKIVKKYAKKDSRIRVFSNKKNKLIAYSLNKGVSLSKGEIIARMDGDDVSVKERIMTQYEVLKKNPKVAIVGADLDVVDKQGTSVSQRKYPTSSKELKKLMFRYSPFSHPVVMFRKSIFNEFGGYREDIFPSEDIDLWFKIGSKYDFASVDRPLLHYTLIQNSSSHRKLNRLEMLTFKIRLNAITKLGYRPSFYDVIYNVLQFFTAYLTPPELRIKLYDFLRKYQII